MSETALVGHCVGCAVPEPPLSGRVHSVFRRACNLALSEGGLVALLGPDLPRTPWGIRLRELPVPFEALLEAGETFETRAEPCADAPVLTFPASGLRLSLAGAARWNGLLPFPEREPDLRAISGTVLSLLRERNWPGLGSLFAPAGTLPEDDASLDGLLRHALRGAARKLAGTVAKRDTATAIEAASGLVGLGNGLTPAGDDLLVGVLAGLRCMALPRSPLAAFAQDLGKALRPLAETRTTDVAKTFLTHAADGLFTESIVNLAKLTAAPGDGAFAPQLRAAAATVLDFGASSGADTLAGLLLAWGLLPIAPQQRIS